ncbi:GNAT family N-acetyltransferase [Roseiarcaceae bacterium H3SJ34-1]|uniref:GNAT family N-acetyltransferase n=1 Tax=Terripilifer ovatus TaxID=3032367 RepID=UPI003AB992F0|nr:GNAT family N-acetyltransferase [Roseiarcaceae bacterium H3SJ34-1]
MKPADVRAPQPADEAAWRRLWAGYTAFYRVDVPEAVTAGLWHKLVTSGADVRGLVAERDGRLVGLANYLFHPSTWSLKPTCYLEDLFVDPEARGSGAGKALILAVEAAARAADASRIYWHTQEYNAPARSLYDTLAPRTSFIVYRKAF